MQDITEDSKYDPEIAARLTDKNLWYELLYFVSLLTAKSEVSVNWWLNIQLSYNTCIIKILKTFDTEELESNILPCACAEKYSQLAKWSRHFSGSIGLFIPV